MRYGYARVSTDDQTLARQRAALAATDCDELVEEVGSGVGARRRLDELLGRLVDGDELVVTELDRLGRSTTEAVLLLDDLIQRGIVLRVLAMPSLDITTNDGRLIGEIMASLAAHERRRTRERQRAGIDAAKHAGRHLGRPPKLSGAQVAEARQMIVEGRTAADVARLFRVSPDTVRRVCAQASTSPASRRN